MLMLGSLDIAFVDAANRKRKKAVNPVIAIQLNAPVEDTGDVDRDASDDESPSTPAKRLKDGVDDGNKARELEISSELLVDNATDENVVVVEAAPVPHLIEDLNSGGADHAVIKAEMLDSAPVEELLAPKVHIVAAAPVAPVELAELVAQVDPRIVSFAAGYLAMLQTGMVDPRTGDTALHKLLEVDATGETLAYLCTAHHATIAQFANIANIRGETPLVKAILSNNVPATRALLPVTNLQAPLMLSGQQTHYAHVACAQQYPEIFPAVIEYMLAACDTPAAKTAALNLRDHRGNNVAQVAILMNAIPCLTTLLTHPELPVTNLNREGHSLLIFAMTKSGDTGPCIEALIEDAVLARFRGLATTADRLGNTPLHYAATIIQSSTYEHQVAPSVECFRTFKQLLTLADDATSSVIANLNLSARNRAKQTPLQTIKSDAIKTWIISFYASKGKDAIAQALRESLAEAPGRCILM